LTPSDFSLGEVGAAFAPSAVTLERPRRRGLERSAMVLGLALYSGLLLGLYQLGSKLVPDAVSVRIAGHSLHLANVHARLLSNAMVLLAMLPGALWLEVLLVGWRGSSLRQMLTAPTASTKTDIAFFALAQGHVMDVVAKVMLLGASMISGLWLRDWIAATFGFELDGGVLPIAAQIPIYFLVYTFCDYWTHRLDHTRYFWPVHRFHHAATEFCVVTATREHPAAFASIFLINVPMAVLGATPEAMIYVNVVITALGFLIHSRIDSGWGWIGRWVVQSPNHHRLHHKLDMTHPTGHFSTAPLWDHLFGTWCGDADQTLPIGVDTHYRHGFWIAPDLLRDYWDFWRGWFRRAA
jgi:sterol desaturase/sphingolipid hydroxylase (fatty acid hydroxylase superfamily)